MGVLGVAIYIFDDATLALPPSAVGPQGSMQTGRGGAVWRKPARGKRPAVHEVRPSCFHGPALGGRQQ